MYIQGFLTALSIIVFVLLVVWYFGQIATSTNTALDMIEEIRQNCEQLESPGAACEFEQQVYNANYNIYCGKEMQEQFPECWNYLCSHKDKLLSRNIHGYTEDTWYRYGRSQSLTKFNGEPKLIWPVLSI